MVRYTQKMRSLYKERSRKTQKSKIYVEYEKVIKGKGESIHLPENSKNVQTDRREGLEVAVLQGIVYKESGESENVKEYKTIKKQ